ncbi:MAG: PP2C family protein-serine/threonine phosphatase [Bacteroidia bacterium]|nr:PP2C family protein-serine/threonine phosphatase [Bacteroidia bacterium]
MKSKASLRRLILSNFKLDVLLVISQAINENLPTEELFYKFENLLRNDLNIGKVLVFSYNNEKWECALASGYSVDTATTERLEKDLARYTEIANIISINHPVLCVFDVIIPVFHKNKVLAYVLIGDIEEEREGVSPTIKHLHFVQTLANLIIVAIENKRLHQDNLRQEAMRKELELASKMQAMLIPSSESLPDNNKLFVSAYYLPYSGVGGDYYDVVKLTDDEYGFCIADVSGKGISAAILMSNFQANLRALFTSRASLKLIVTRLNWLVMNNAHGEKFITLFIAKYNSITRTLEYINAGHNQPALFRAETKTIEYLSLGCIGVGMFNNIPAIIEGAVTTGKDDKLICYTDGLVETENEKQEEFGTENMERCILNGKRVDKIIHDMISELDKFKGSNVYADDISILGIEFY